MQRALKFRKEIQYALSNTIDNCIIWNFNCQREMKQMNHREFYFKNIYYLCLSFKKISRISYSPQKTNQVDISKTYVKIKSRYVSRIARQANAPNEDKSSCAIFCR